MNRTLTSARMACNDFEFQVRIAEAESHIAALLDSIQRPARGIESERDRLDRIIADGLTATQGFGMATEAFVKHGFEVYSHRRSARYRIR